MPAFDYVGVDAAGKRHKGILEADSARHARQLLRDKGWVPVVLGAAAENTQSTTVSARFSRFLTPGLSAPIWP